MSNGIEKMMQYMDSFGCTKGWFVIFDQHAETSWDDKIFIKKEMIDGKTMTVTGT